ncbi:helicase-related protein [Capnocytophaga canimorsus]|uniref:helicase-related protein n=1 Tax=Capnocytophaga canimorsus TaxID=28188 RepID=UPI001562EA45|nr:helicase-related protein [Capnocytophaga canimorsus]
MELINNIHKTLAEDLRSTLTSGSRLSIAASCFSIYAYQELRKELEQIEELRFVFTSPTFIAEKENKAQREFYIPRLNRERSLTGSEFEIQIRNELTQKSIAKECAEWIRRKVRFKSNITKENMVGFGVVDSTSYMPLLGFTTVDLGVERGNNAYTIIQKADAPFSASYTQLFEQLWNDKERLQDVTNEVVESISSVYKENPPELIYFVTLFNLFREFLDDISEDVLPNEATGFKETAVWKKLYKFQQDAALGIINKLERYNGCILADSVGLGKTFTAISVIKYYELRNKSVLVLCPKKLYQNWSTYRNNYKNNPLHSDRLRYDVLYHTDLGRVSGENNGINLGKINWGNYDLVVIDESHNFRNGGKISTDADDLNPRKNRYLRLLDDVIRSGVKTKVLMLSATPVNNRFNDLKNQLELAYEGNVEAFDKLLNTERSIDDIFRQAQFEYNRWSKLPEAERTTEALLQSLSFDFFEVLDSVTIARSRRHIEQYYDTTEIGSFPKRLPVLSHRTQLTLDTDLIDYNQIYTLLSDLNLAIYTPSDFILKSRMDKYVTIDDEGNVSGLSRSGRELGIRRLMCINMLKRLESSIYSFRLTVKRLVALLSATLTKIEQVEDGEAIRVGQYDFNEGFDIDDLNDELLIGGGKTTIDLRDMDYLGWKNHLLTDLQLLQTLLHKVAQITPDKDAKLQHLLSDIEQKIAQPINAGNKKVIVFTAFSDTAEYLYDALSQTLYDRHSLHSVLVTGGIDACSTMKLPQRNKMTFDTALTLFSPRSKDKDTLLPNVSGEIDILIATDCISEGQNLQDCDYLINYDIHWNPVRIIQRFGRIDRIGSHNSCIQMVNYWPNIQLDEYINLKARVENRMKVSVMTSTGDDNLLSNDEQGDLEYRHKQLERLQTEVVDLEEMNTSISILDLGLNEFRLDLLDYIKRHGDLEQTPFGLHAVVPSSEKMPPGVIYILKNNNQGVNIDRKNQLHPFYMVYLTREGDVHCDHLSVKRLLDLMRWACRGQSAPLLELCHLFNKETKEGKKMEAYSHLLHRAVESIIEVKREQEIDSLFSEGTTTALKHKIKGLEDFELIAFLVVK